MVWASFLCAKHSSVPLVLKFLAKINKSLMRLKFDLFIAHASNDKLLFKRFKV